MFTKFNLFLGTLAFTFVASAFGSESKVAGRYHVDAPSNEAASTAQTGRYETSGTVVHGANQGAGSFAQAGESQVAGRYQSNTQDFAPVSSYNVAPSYAQMKTQRADAADVSNKPAVKEQK